MFTQHKNQNFGYEISFLFLRYRNYNKSYSSLKIRDFKTTRTFRIRDIKKK